MRKKIDNMIVLLLCAFFLVTGTGINVHCHCTRHSDLCHCSGHSHQAGHCHTHYLHLTDALQMVSDSGLPERGVNDLLFDALPPVGVVDCRDLLLYRGERIHDGRVPIPILARQYREMLCQWLI